jgi:protein phosphatase PTC1
MQKLSKTDPALSVPQGSLNNSAGESQPTPNSSFLVGVTEDKNKKCRRTMEDTHSYLYNFLGTPAPVLATDSTLSKKSSREDKNSLTTIPSDSGQHVVETDNGYFAIFDGHAGTFAAEWCGKKLHVLLEDLMRKYPNTPVPELLDQTYTAADNQLEKLPLKNSGCTAITAVLRWEDRVPTNHSATGSQAIASLAAAAAKEAEKNEKNSEASKDAKDSTPRSNSTAEAAAAAIQEAKQKATRQRVLYTANVGDARIVLCRNGKALRLSYDHKGMDENEGRRISKAGGLILNNRVNGVLAVTRALGDSYLKDLVTGHPYTTETVIQPDQDEFLILACDGVSLNVHTAPNVILTQLAVGCLLRSRGGRPRSECPGSTNRLQDARGSRLGPFLHRQFVSNGRSLRPTEAANEHETGHWSRHRCHQGQASHQ